MTKLLTDQEKQDEQKKKKDDALVCTCSIRYGRCWNHRGIK